MGWLMNSTIKLISTDFDGTLFAQFEHPPVSAGLQELIRDLQAGGSNWIVNTGRDLSSLMEAFARARIQIEPDYLVLVEREIYHHCGPEYRGLEPWNAACTRTHAELFARVRPDLPRLVAWISARFHARIYEDAYSPFCLVAGNNGNAEAIHDYLDEYCRTVPDLTIVRNDVYARFSHAAYSKGTALAELTRGLGLTAANVFAVGDQLNDLPMLDHRFAHFLAAPQNAVPRVKDAVLRQSGYVSPLCHGDGVADALRFYLSQ
jgi:hydroxymethylpyrimidine pyrophosphatase-like HAD family hydrolase